MPNTKPVKKTKGRPKGSKNKTTKVQTLDVKPSTKKKGRPKGSKNKTKNTVQDVQEPVLEKVVSDSTPNLFTINEHELFNVSSNEYGMRMSPKDVLEGSVFGLVVERIKDGKVYFALTKIKGR